MTLPRSLTRRTALRLGAGAAVALAGCAGTPSRTTPPAAPAAPADGALLLPNENLVLQGVPPIPLSLVRQVEKYTDFRGHAFVDWHPQREEMLVSHRRGGANTAQLFAVAAPLAEPRAADRLRRPGHRARATSRARAATWCSRAAAAATRPTSCTGWTSTTRAVTPLTDTDERHEHGRLAAPLGPRCCTRRCRWTAPRRAAAARDRPPTLWLTDPLQPEGAAQGRRAARRRLVRRRRLARRPAARPDAVPSRPTSRRSG